MDATNTTGWEIKSIERSARNGRFYIQGTNHETTDPLFREFGWHVQSIADSRYWLSPDCKISPEAQKLL
jgi:hypothetical protein